MTHPLVKQTTLFVALVLLQACIFNHIEYWGYVNPMIYILFIIAAPYRENRTPLIFLSFFIGLMIDMFSNTGGLHAASSVLIAYARKPILVVVFGKNFEYQELKLTEYPFTKVLSYTTMMVLLHHTLFYFLEVFNFAHVLITLLKIVVASVFSITACLLFIYLFGGSKK